GGRDPHLQAGNESLHPEATVPVRLHPPSWTWAWAWWAQPSSRTPARGLPSEPTRRPRSVARFWRRTVTGLPSSPVRARAAPRSWSWWRKMNVQGRFGSRASSRSCAVGRLWTWKGMLGDDSRVTLTPFRGLPSGPTRVPVTVLPGSRVRSQTSDLAPLAGLISARL